MADYLFISQSMIDGWLMEGKIDFLGDIMTIRGEDKRYKVEPAVRFVRVVGDEPDSEGFVAKVRTLKQVAKDGGEHYHDSVIFGDVAYDVQNGFIATVHAPEEDDAAPKAPAQQSSHDDPEHPKKMGVVAVSPLADGSSTDSKQEELADEATDREMEEETDEVLLTRFLLKNLR